ncbi:Lrp/AsnC family transcriptional regulator [Candidatus Thorarchaeota archaeon]|nr:MAG: Lrp/AsnC family transcriptional regulator [Candidatus Thorarchaeota archaeon]
MSRTTRLDDLDLAILRELQQECRTPLQEVAESVGAPTSTVHYRLKRLERANIIEGYYAKLNPEKLQNEYITVIRLQVELSPGYYESIGEELAQIPGVWGVYLILGDFDFLVMTRSKGRKEFMDIINQVLEIKGIKRSSTSVVAKVIKEDPRLELNEIGDFA